MAGSGGSADGIGGLPVPGQQFGNALGGVIGNLRQDVGEIGLWVATDGDAAQGTLGRVVVEAQAAVKAAGQCRPARPHIAEGRGELGFALQLEHGLVSPNRQRLGDRFGSELALVQSLIGG